MDENATKELIKGTKLIWQMRGGNKEPSKEEQVTIDFAFATVCSIANIKKGEKFTIHNIWVKRPGIGEILAEYFSDILGKTASRNINNDVQLKLEDII
jgi:N-acetylneuraminate synthase